MIVPEKNETVGRLARVSVIAVAPPTFNLMEPSRITPRKSPKLLPGRKKR